MATSEERLRAFQGDPKPGVMLDAARMLMEHALSDPWRDQPILNDGESLYNYLRVTLGSCRTECLRVMFLNLKGRLIRDEVMWTGTIACAPLYVREIAKRALDLGAMKLILIHNHPSGSTAASTPDIAVTRDLIRALKPLDVELCEHLIVTRGDVVSFRELGLL